MNYWVEYWKTISTENKNYYAQSQIIKWEKPDKKDIRKRFCQSKDDACKFATAMQEQGYMASVKQDGIFYK